MAIQQIDFVFERDSTCADRIGDSIVCNSFYRLLESKAKFFWKDHRKKTSCTWLSPSGLEPASKHHCIQHEPELSTFTSK
ncbi:MAG: hypothetical protein K0U86_17885 [Planctomycetes bacterium]|nr:hypothetical protein [Planctomycetota bacterium]MCH9776803.1 hypothetical protein [Planctomycetota bacterium]